MLLHILAAGWAQTLQIEDTLLITRDRWRDTCFGLINKDATQIPSGYLLDYALATIDKDLDGVGANDTIQSWGDFFYYYNILELSKVNNNGNLTITNDLFVNAKRYFRDNNGTIPLLFLYRPFQKIDSTALSNNLFTITTDSIRLMDVPGRPSSPYLTKEIFMFSPIINSISQFNSISFSFPASYWQMAGITTVTIDFDDGQGNRNISQGGIANVSYATEGFKNITATIVTGSGTRTAKCRINYRRPPFYLKSDTSWNISVEPAYVDENDYLGISRPSGLTSVCNAQTVFEEVHCDINPGAQVSVYNGCDLLFDKPIIVVEGFDVDNSMTNFELFDRFNRYDFIDNMRSAGYDFVFVNFKNPLDFIENNAKVLEEVINRVNATKVGSNRGSVIGFSMGGLIARWCLKDMEDRSIDHKMAHYFSYDAPHQGANIPLGLQYFFGELEKDFSFLKWRNLGGSSIFPPFYQLVQAAHSPASKQLLVTKSNYNNFPFNWNPTLNTLDPIRAAFALRLVQKGYPQNLTSHGLAFGRGNNSSGTKQAGNGIQFGGFGPGSKIFDGNVDLALVSFSSSAYAVAENGNNDYILRYRFLGFKVIRIFIPIGTRPVLRVRNFKYANQYPYDDAPGSYESTQTQFVEQIKPIAGLASPPSNQGHHGHNFISTVSALDLKNQGYSSSTSWQSNNLFYRIDNDVVNPGQVTGNTISSSLSPFNNVLTYTSDCGTVSCESRNDDADEDGFSGDFRNNDWNQYHNGFISRQTSHYIQRKILNTTPGSCPDICNNSNTISGPDLICNNENYQLAGPNPTGLNILWECEGGKCQITAGQGTRNVTVTKITNGADFIRVTLTNGCGSITIKRFPIRLGGFSSSDYPITGPSSACKNQNVNFSTNTLPGATNYQWTWSSNLTYLSGQGTSNLSLRTGSTTGTGVVTVRVANACDAGGSPATKTFPINNCGFSFTALPNPSTGLVNISTTQTGDFTTSGGGNVYKIYQIKVFDQSGNVKLINNYSNGVTNTSINLSSLVSGIYTIQAYNGIDHITKQIIKQ